MQHTELLKYRHYRLYQPVLIAYFGIYFFCKWHTSPALGWYDQDENEWVMVIEGSGTIEFDDGVSVTLDRGDYLNIPAHRKHKVSWTDPSRVTIWLAVFYV